MAARKATRKSRSKTTRRSTRRTTSARSTSKLSPAQKAQRKYAAAMRSIRTRAGRVRRGVGKIRTRRAATTLRRKLGLKS